MTVPDSISFLKTEMETSSKVPAERPIRGFIPFIFWNEKHSKHAYTSFLFGLAVQYNACGTSCCSLWQVVRIFPVETDFETFQAPGLAFGILYATFPRFILFSSVMGMLTGSLPLGGAAWIHSLSSWNTFGGHHSAWNARVTLGDCAYLR